MAQSGSAPALGAGGRRFKSCCSDQDGVPNGWLGQRMSVARIYKPAKTAMQSGMGKSKEWVLDYEPAEPRAVEPLMGWTSSGDMRQQLRLRFHTKEEAIAY